jgi:putative transposase
MSMPYFHVRFSTKDRKWLLQGDVLDAVRELMSEIANGKGINLVEHEAIVDHVHLLLDLPDKAALPQAMMFLKGVSARKLFWLFPEIRHDAHTLNFWQAGYGSKIVPECALPSTRSYIRTQWERLDSYDRWVMPRGSARGKGDS